MSRIAAAKEKLLQELRVLVRELCPGGALRGRIYSTRNPARADRKAGSFVIWMSGPATGGWKDYASGEQGDILDLVALALGFDRKAALQWAEERCGLKGISDADREKLKAQAQKRKLEGAQQDKRNAASKRDRARDLFVKSMGNLSGTQVESYFATRGVCLADVPNLDRTSFRFNPRMEYWLGVQRDAGGRKVRSGELYPALVSAFRDERGVGGAIHVTYLKPDGSDKAPVEKAKLIFPSPSGMVIRVSHGESGLTPEQAAEQGVRGPCLLAEGIEDCVTAAEAMPELRVWAAGSLPNLLTVYDHPCVSSWLVLKDNDWGKEQAQALFDRAIDRLRCFGKPVEILSAPAGKDINDYRRLE